MNLWQRFEKGNNPNVNSHSISFHYGKDIDEPLKDLIIDFSKWLRKSYIFPVSINIYIVSTYRVQLRDGTPLYGRFRWFPNRGPNIQIAGAIEPNVLEEYEIDTIYDGVLSSLVHELTHYFQWVLKLEQDDRISERQANYYRYRIIDKYRRSKNNFLNLHEL